MSKYPKWSSGEIKFLKEHYLKLSNKEIARFLKRPLLGITYKINQFKLYDKSVEQMRILTNLAETEKAYIAGIVDGEGCLSINICYDKSRKPFRAVPTVEISNTDSKVLKWIAHKANWGKWNTKRPYTLIENRNANLKPYKCYHLTISDRRRVSVFLKTILPYLRIKKTLAEKILNFYRLHALRSPYTIEDWKRALEVKRLVNARHAQHIKSREYFARCIKELEVKRSKNQVDI